MSTLTSRVREDGEGIYKAPKLGRSLYWRRALVDSAGHYALVNMGCCVNAGVERWLEDSGWDVSGTSFEDCLWDLRGLVERVTSASLLL